MQRSIVYTERGENTKDQNFGDFSRHHCECIKRSKSLIFKTYIICVAGSGTDGDKDWVGLTFNNSKRITDLNGKFEWKISLRRRGTFQNLFG